MKRPLAASDFGATWSVQCLAVPNVAGGLAGLLKMVKIRMQVRNEECKLSFARKSLTKPVLGGVEKVDKFYEINYLSVDDVFHGFARDAC